MEDKIIFISDIHGNYEALAAVLDDIKAKNFNFKNTYCLGDIVGYGPRPNETINLLRKYQIVSILGNYDEAVGFYLPNCGCSITSNNDKVKTMNSLQWTAEHTDENNKEYLRGLEEQLTLEFKGKSLLLTHGSPNAINEYLHYEDIELQEEIAEELLEDVIVFGHTHIPYFKWVNDKLFINPGSVGRPKDGDNRACYCILDMNDLTVEFVRVSYNIEKVALEIESSGLLNVFAEVLRKGKDQ